METTKYLIMDSGQGTHEYVITVIETETSKTYEMRYSNGEHWSSSLRGEFIMSATDNGNEIKLNEKINKTLEYSKFIEIKIFLNFIDKYDKDMSTSYFVAKESFNV